MRPAQGQMGLSACRDELIDHGIIAANHGVFLGGRNFPDPSKFTLNEEFFSTMQDLVEVLRLQGITLILTPIPTQPMVFERSLIESDPFQGAWDGEGTVSAYHVFLATLSVYGINVVDLFSPVDYDWDPSDDNQIPYLRQERHWSPLGSRLSAEVVAEVIMAQPTYRDLETSTFITFDQGVVELPLGNWLEDVEATCGVDLVGEEVHQYSTEKVLDTPLGLFDEEVFPIVYVGSSFGDPTWNFGGFLAEFTGLDVLTLGLVSGGVFTAFEEYLLSPNFAEQKPAFIVWEFPFIDMAGEQPGTGSQADILSGIRQILALTQGSCAPDHILATREVRIDPRQAVTRFPMPSTMTGEAWRKGRGAVVTVQNRSAPDGSFTVDEVAFKDSGRFLMFDQETGASLRAGPSLSPLGFGLKRGFRRVICACRF